MSDFYEVLEARKERAKARAIHSEILHTIQKGAANPELDNKPKLQFLRREHYNLTGIGGP